MGLYQYATQPITLNYRIVASGLKELDMRQKMTALTQLAGFLLIISSVQVKAIDLSEVYDRSVENDPQLGAAKTFDQPAEVLDMEASSRASGE